MDKKNKSHIYAASKRLISEDTHRLKVKGRKMILHENGKKKKAGVAVLISNEIDFKTKAIVRDKEGHYVMVRETIQQENNPSKHLCTQQRST